VQSEGNIKPELRLFGILLILVRTLGYRLASCEALPLYQHVQHNYIKHRQVASDVTSTAIVSEGLPLQHGVVERTRTVAR